ncbi:CbiG protein/precorrin-3B C17-methyltransferase [Pseudomonas syringae pv. antirrhini]|uniref:CbiG protein/precorrin-3B C17-methyltransferase n=1 Tax=Pseudomonas syringae pv. antirrhini TaxID=251702 RepID=A0A0N8QPW5_9PSED|nr:CbiG protein/precorrin-3B C17-methyltransferase [Pseudomonas syringae pv. antirrhini]RMP35634.1 CbiG protein/precorrin-3B C17-methyltransferase [Pseudomonas syringae pv. antirrhini]RMP38416.1 CbiG protein/precorrin-3B C17-methyltransferase [Pseudomonas syringae pv. antirrhini]RMW24360.1 CbiG protein/precorrin-3B C17-methyltransferase [Pseudomonas syringae pv. antirrhini]
MPVECSVVPDLSGDHVQLDLLLLHNNLQSGDLTQTFIDTGRRFQAVRFISLVLLLSIGTHELTD